MDASEFQPDPGRSRWVPGDPITIVALSRLVYRKGCDILALVIPEICERHPHVNFIIGGWQGAVGVVAAVKEDGCGPRCQAALHVGSSWVGAAMRQGAAGGCLGFRDNGSSPRRRATRSV